MITTTTERRFQIDLDVTSEQLPFRLDDLQDDLVKDLDLELEVINPAGPGGGWPIVRFTGTKETLCRLLIRYHEGDLGAVIDSWNADADPVA